MDFSQGKKGDPPGRDLRGTCEGPARGLILEKRDEYLQNWDEGERRKAKEEREGGEEEGEGED